MSGAVHGQNPLDTTVRPAHVSSNALHVAQFVWDTDILDWVKQTADATAGGGGATPVPYTKRIAQVGDTLYVGEAIPGSAENAPLWRIKRISGDPIAIRFAGGNSNFDKVWADHAALTYI